MRINHILGGMAVFGVGLYTAFTNILYVVEFIKGIAQPIMITLGICAALAVIFGNPRFRVFNSFNALALLGVGCYGVYDEYYATMDFLNGILPVLLIVGGILSTLHGIRSLKNSQ